MAAIGTGWADGAWIFDGWIFEAWDDDPNVPPVAGPPNVISGPLTDDISSGLDDDPC